MTTNMLFAVVTYAFMVAAALAAEPEVNCTAPHSPEHGQVFLYQEGQVVKYVCDPGYVLIGKELVKCIEGKWEEPYPAVCVDIDADVDKISDAFNDASPPPVLPLKPLFDWGSKDEEEAEMNSTSDDEMPLSDEARLRMVLYPSRIVNPRFRTARLRSATELEDEEKKRSKSEDGKRSTTTIHLDAPPSVLYVRRTIKPAKVGAEEESKTASVHMTVDNTENGDQVQLVSLPRAAVAQNDKGDQLEEARRHMYWWAHHYYPRHASLMEYRTGNPMVVTLSESQINWINSLHPELRDQYLRDMYIIRADDAVEGARAQAYLNRYDDAYNVYNYYNRAHYYRQPLSLIVEAPTSTYDYSCHQAHSSFVKAPRLPHMHIARYDRRQNPNPPHNHYLSAVYRCNPGYVMLDARHTDLHCSKRSWIGVSPVCVPRA